MSNRFEGFAVGGMIQSGLLGGLEIPAWIEQDITVCDVRAICQGGCASGAYMPAVMYFEAKQTMAQHGEDIFDFIIDRLGESALDNDFTGFGMKCCAWVCAAVELWAAEALSLIEELEEEMDEEDVA
jgi:hypothetical protein